MEKRTDGAEARRRRGAAGTKTGTDKESEDDTYSTIGELARKFGVSLRTLRFYEDRGLLYPHRKGPARLYSSRDRLRLEVILKGKQLGFTLAEIREFLKHDDSGIELNLPADQILNQIRHIERQLSALEATLAELRLAHQRAIAHAA